MRDFRCTTYDCSLPLRNATLDITMRSIVFALCLFPTIGVACQPALHDWTDETKRAGIILTGHVTGERRPDYEAEVLDGGDPESVSMWDTRLVRVVPVKVHKGTWSAVLEVAVPCAESIPKLYERVVAIGTADGKRWLLVPAWEERAVLP